MMKSRNARSANTVNTQNQSTSGNMTDSVTKKSSSSQTKTQYIAALAATGGAFAFGMVLGWSAPVRDILVDSPEDKGYDFPITNEEFDWIGSVVNIGAAIVCCITGTMIQIFGRKSTMLVLVLPFTLGWCLLIFGVSVPMLLIGRFILGVAGGAFCVAAPTYTGEIAEPRIRGTLGNFFQLMLVIGIFFTYAIGPYIRVVELNVIGVIIPIIFGILFWYMPESPTYLISKGKKEEAAISLIWLRGSEYDFNDELNQLQADYEAQEENTYSKFKILARRSTINALIISLGLMFFQQVSGINAVIFFTTQIFDATNTDIDTKISTIIVGLMQVLAVAASAFAVDKLGRRLLLIPSSIAMALCSLFLGLFFKLKDDQNESIGSLGWLQLISLCVFIIFFSFGFGPIPWTMLGELFSNDIKGVASSAAGAFSWTLAFIVTSTFNPIKKAIGDGQTFWVFSCFTLLGLLFVIFFVPETKGKTLAEIQRNLGRERKTRQLNVTQP